MKKTFYVNGARVAEIDGITKTSDNIPVYWIYFPDGSKMEKHNSPESAENSVLKRFPDAVVGNSVEAGKVAKMALENVQKGMEFYKGTGNSRIINIEYCLGKYYGILDVLQMIDIDLFVEVAEKAHDDVETLTKEARPY